MAATLAIIPQQAQAQVEVGGKAYQGTFDTQVLAGNGAVNIVQTTNLDTITINTANTTATDVRAVINWSPADTAAGSAPIIFLPTGATANYVAGANVSDFTILNRIIPTGAAAARGIRFDGTITSRIAENPGGSVFFYSPNGIIAGAGSIFDVGNLVLTASDISLADNLSVGTTTPLSFGQATRADAAVTIEAGAQITAANSGSYVALVAPQINQRGSVFVNGSAVYVAAEAADLLIQDRLFGIAIRTGTSVSDAITHTGSTTSDAPVSFDDKRRVYMASIAKNDAITMLVGGSIGYTPATEGAFVDGAIILSAGSGIDDISFGVGGLSAGTAPANLVIGGSGTSEFRNAITVKADGDVRVSPDGNSSLTFGSDLSIIAGREAGVSVANNQSITVSGDLSVRTTNSADGARAFVSSSFTPIVDSTRGLLTVGGRLTLNGGATQIIEGVARRSVAELNIAGGDISSGSEIALNTGPGFFGFGAAGGDTQVTVTGGGSLTAQSLILNSSARIDGVGNFAQGGTASLTVSDGMVNANFVQLNAFGIGVDGASAAGGTVNLNLTGGGIAFGSLGIDAGASVELGGEGLGNVAAVGDAPQIGDIPSSAGGSIFVRLNNPIITVAGGISLNVDASVARFGGGEGGFSAAAAGDMPALGGTSNFTGGTVSFVTTGGTFSASALSLSASAIGSGNAAEGGDVELIADGTAISVGSISLNADGIGANGFDVGGSAEAGTVRLETVNGGSIVTDNSAFNTLSATATAGAGAIGGDAIGGLINIVTNDGRMDLGSVLLASVDGFAGSTRNDGFGPLVGTRGGSGQAGTLNLRIGVSGSGDTDEHFRANTLNFNAVSTESGSGFFSSFSGDGANATGGNISITQFSGSSNINGLFASADADGGDGGSSDGFVNAGIGGNSTSGNVLIDIVAGRAEWRTINAASIANGGNGGNGSAGGEGGIPFDAGPGGDAVAGRVALSIGSGTLVSSDVQLTYAANGGDSGLTEGEENFGAGGNASGGIAEVTLQGLATLESGYGSGSIGFSVGGNNRGGDGSIGGTADGGQSIFTVLGTGANSDSLFAVITADAVGGNGTARGGTGGNAIGGTATLRIAGGSQAISSATVGAEGFGGQGGTEFGYGDIGGEGGTATGGLAQILSSVDADIDSITLSSTALGGSGGLNRNGGNGGDALSGGLASLEVTGGQFTTNSLQITADSQGGSGANGTEGFGGAAGSAAAGSIRIAVEGAATQVTIGSASIRAVGVGASAGQTSNVGFGIDVTGGTGGTATGGDITVLVRDGSVLDFTGSSNFSVDAQGGDGGAAFSNAAANFAGNGGSATAGLIDANGLGGTLRVSGARFSANATGGFGGEASVFSSPSFGGAGGNATAGSVRLGGITDFGSIDDSIRAEAVSIGGSGGRGLIGGNGGDAFASDDVQGGIVFSLGIGTPNVTLTSVELDASGTGGTGGTSAEQDTAGGTGGTGNGGRVTFRNDGPTTSVSSLVLGAQGIGGNAGAGSIGGEGGAANGGTAMLDVVEGNVSITAQVVVTANAFGATGAEGFTASGGGGGAGRAGLALINVGGLGQLSISSLDLSADGFGGDGGKGFGGAGSFGGNGGTGTGGTARIDNNGTFSAQTGPDGTLLSISARGSGGFGGGLDSFADGGIFGAGGTGTGGTASVISNSGGSFVFTEFAIDARGLGGGYSIEPITTRGLGGNGAGIGGRAELIVTGNLDASDVLLTASGIGGQGIIGDNNIAPGAGGSGTGGSILASFIGANATTSLSFDASGIGGRGGSSPSFAVDGAAGGAGRGGQIDVVVNGFAGTTLVTGPIVADARAIGGVGGAGLAGGNGGSATGGRTLITVASETTSTGSQLIASAVGGAGGEGSIGVGGAGGNAAGGLTSLTVSREDTNVTLENTVFDITATGGNAGETLFSTPGSSGIGRNGGDALGGEIVVGSVFGTTLTLGGNLSFLGDGTGGRGGSGLRGSAGGLGGGGVGGSVEFFAQDATFVGGNITLSIFGTGGLGGDGGDGVDGVAGLAGAAGANGTLASLNGENGQSGGDGTDAIAGGAGGMGGNGTGGRFTLTNQDAASVTFDSLTLDVSGIGGMGGNGGLGGNGGAGGDGGQGGRGADNFSFVPPFDGGNGGAGGNGGNAGAGGNGGAAGGGGFGDGGRITIRNFGGAISLGNVTVTADGVGSISGSAGDGGLAGTVGNGGAGGLGGESGYGDPGTAGLVGSQGGIANIGQTGDGNNGFAFGGGGTVDISFPLTGEQSPGTIRAGDIRLTANGRNAIQGIGGGGGLVSVFGTTTENPNPFVFNSLSIEALGNFGGNVAVNLGVNRASVTGDISINTTGDVVINTAGVGGIDAGGNFDITAFGSVLANHDDQPGMANTINAERVNIRGLVGIDALNGGRFVARGEDGITLRSDFGDISVADLLSANNIVVSAGFNANIGKAEASGSPNSFGGGITGGVIDIRAGHDRLSLPPGYAVSDIVILEKLTATGNIELRAGGDLFLQSGATLDADNAIIFESGDDVILNNALLSSALDLAPDVGYGSFGFISIGAGALTEVDGRSPDDVSSLIGQGGSLTAAGNSVLLSGNAISFRFSEIEADTVSAQIFNAPTSGVDPRDDDGLLVGDCLEGNLCIGSITAATSIVLGGANAIYVDGASALAADSINVSARDLIDVGTGAELLAGGGGLQLETFGLTSLGIDATLNAVGGVSINTGDLQLNSGAQILGDAVSIFALPSGSMAGEVRLGFQSLINGTNVSIFAERGIDGVTDSEGDFSLGSITATEKVSIGTNGSITLATLNSFDPFDTIGSNGDVTETGTLIVPGSFTAGGVGVGNGDNSIRAGNIAVGGANATDNIRFEADGAIFLSFAQAGTIGLTAGGSVDTGELFGTGGVTITGSDVIFQQIEAQSGSVGLEARAGSIIGGSVVAVNDLTLLADTAVDVGALTGAGVFVDAGTSIATGNILGGANDIRLTAASGLSTGNIAATGGSIFLTNTSGLLSTGAITASNDFTLDTGSLIDITSIGVGDDIRVTGTAAAAFGTLTTTGLGNDDETDGSNIVIAATGVSLATANSAGNLAIAAGAGGILMPGFSVARGAISLQSTGAGSINVNTLTSDDFISVNLSGSGLISIGRATTTGIVNAISGDIDVFGGGNVAIGTIDAFNSLRVFAGGTFDLSAAITTGDHTFITSNGRMSLGAIDTGGSLGLSSGDTITAFLPATSNWSVGEDVSIQASGAVSLGTVSAGDDISISTSSGAITAVALRTRGDGRDDRAVTNAEGFGISSSEPDGSNILLDNLDSGLNITVAELTAANSVDVTSGGVIGSGSGTIRSLGLNGLGGDIALTGAGVTLGTVRADDGAVAIRADGGTITVTTALAHDDLSASGGVVTLTNATSLTGDIAGSASSGLISVATGNAVGDITLDGPGLLVGSLTAGSDIGLSSGDADVRATGTLTASRDITINAASSAIINTALANAGEIAISAGGAVSATSLTATLGEVSIFGAGVSVTSATAGAGIEFASISNLSFGALLSGGATALSAWDGLSGGSVTAGTDISILGFNPNVTSITNVAVDSLTAGDDIDVKATGDLTGTTFRSTGAGADSEGTGSNIFLISQQALDVDTLDAATSAGAFALNVTGLNWQAGEDLVAGSENNGTTSIGTAIAGDDVGVSGGTASLNVGTSLGSGPGNRIVLLTQPGNDGFRSFVFNDFDSIIGSSVRVGAIGTATGGTLTAADTVVAEGATVNLTGTATGANIQLLSTAGNLTTAALVADQSVVARATGGDISTGSITTDTGNVDLAAFDGSITTGLVNTGGRLLVNAFDSATLEGAVVTGLIDIEAGGLVAATGAITSEGGTVIDGGSIGIGNASSDAAIQLISRTGGVTAANLSGASGVTINSAATVAAGNIVSTNGDVTVGATGAITTGDLTANSGSVALFNTLGLITTGLITAANDFSLTTGSDLDFGGVSVGDDIRITTSGNAALGRLTTRGTGTDNETDGSNIVLSIGGDAFVEHAEADGDFRANSTNFATSLNSIITGGDIVIVTNGNSDLGNSNAGGQIFVDADGRIDFASLTSGTTTRLAAGTLIAGGTIVAGSTVNANANGTVSLASVANTGGSIVIGGSGVALGSADAAFDLEISDNGGGLTITGSAEAARSVQLQASGTVDVASVTAGSNIIVSGSGNVSVINAVTTGLFDETGYGSPAQFSNISVIADGTLTIGSANAFNSFNAQSNSITANSLTAGNNIFVVANNGATLGSVSAGDMLGVRGQSVGGSGTWVAGEDILILDANEIIGNQTSAVANLIAGDDITVRSVNGSISVGDLTTTGAGRDDRALDFNGAFQITASAGTGADILISTVPDGTSIVTGALNAADDITIDATTSIALNGNATVGGLINLTSLGGGITTQNITASSVAINSATTLNAANITSSAADIAITAVGAITTGDLAANLGSVSLANGAAIITTGLITVGNDFTISTDSDLDFGGVSVGDDIRITTSGNAELGRLTTKGTGTDNEVDGSNIVLSVGGNAFVDHAEADNDFIATAASFATSLNSIITGGDIIITTAGDVDLGNSNAGGLVSVNAGQRIDFASVTSGSTTDLFGNIIAGGSILAGSDIQAFAGTDATLADVTSSGGSVRVQGINTRLANATAATAINLSGGLSVTLTGTARAGQNINVLGSPESNIDLNALVSDSFISVQNTTGGQATGPLGSIRIGTAQTTGLFDETGYGTPAQFSDILVSSAGNIGTGALSAFNSIQLDADGAIASTGTLTAGNNIFVLADGTASLGAINAGEMLGVRGVSVTGSGSWIAGEEILIIDRDPNFNPLSIGIATLTAGDDITVESEVGSVTVGDLTTTAAGRDDRTLGFDSSFFIQNVAPGAGSDILLRTLTTGGAVVAGNLTAADDIVIISSGALTVNGTARTLGIGATEGSSDISFAADGNILTAQTHAVGAVSLRSSQAVSLVGGSAATDFIVQATVGDIVQSGLVSAGRDVSYLAINNNVSVTGSVSADHAIFANAGGSIDFANAQTTGAFDETGYGGIPPQFSNIVLDAGANITIGTANAFNDVQIRAGGSVDAASLIAGNNVFSVATSNTTIGSIDAGEMIGVRGVSVSGSGIWQAGEDILIVDQEPLSNSDTVSLSTLVAGDDIVVRSANGALTVGDLTTTGTGRDDRSVEFGSSFFITGSAANGSDIALSTVPGGTNIITGALSSADDISISAQTNITTGNATAGGQINLVTNSGGITTGNLAAADVAINSATTLNAGNIITNPGNIGITTVGAITTGDLTAILGSISLANAASAITTGLITSGNDFTLNTASDLDFSGVTAGDDIRITTSGNALFGRLTSTGIGTDNESDGSNIVLSIGGNTFVDHAESAGNFIASAGRFETGPATIITDGDIVISTSGDAILATSRAGGAVNISAGGVIDFSSLTAGTFTALSGNMITGGDSLSGNSFSAFGQNGVTLGTVSSGPSLQVFNRDGNLQIASGTSTGNIAIGGEGLGSVVAGTLLADGDIFVSSGGDLSVGSAIARGIFTFGAGEGGTGNGGAFTTDGNVFVSADGAATLNSASARSAIGITGSSVSGTGVWTAGEDVLVETSGAVALNSLAAGDDLTIDAGGPIALTSGVADGTGRDDRALSLETGYGGSGFFAINGSPADGSDARLTSGGNITVGTLRAADDDFVIATGNISIDLLTAWGISTTDGRSDALVDAGGSVLIQTADIDDSIAVRGASVLAQNWTAGEDIGVSSSGSVSFDRFGAGDRLSIVGNSIFGDTVVTLRSGPNDRRIDFGGFPQFVSETGGRAALIDLTSIGTTQINTIISSGDVDILAGTLISPATSGTIGAAGNVFVQTSDDARLATVNAGGSIAVNGGRVFYSTLTSGTSTAIVASGAISGTVATAGTTLRLSGDTVTAGMTSAGGNITVAAQNGATLNTITSAAEDIQLSTLNGTLAIGSATAARTINATSRFGSVDATGPFTAGTDVRLVGRSVAANNLLSGNMVTVTATGGNASIVSATAGGNIVYGATGDVEIGSSTAAGNAFLTAGGLITANDLRIAGTVDARGGGIDISGGAALNFMHADATLGDVAIATVGPLTVQSSVAANDVRLSTTGPGADLIVTSADSGDDIILTSAGNAALGTLVTRGAAVDGLDPQPDGSNITATAANAITYTTLNAINSLALTAGGGITGGNATAGNTLTALAGGTTVLGALTAGGQVTVRTTAGDLTTGGVIGGVGVDFESAGALTTGNATATLGDVALSAATALATGAISAVAGSISLTNGAAPLTTGTLVARDDFVLATGSNLTFAGISVGDDISITAAGDADIGALTTTGLGTDAELNRGNISLAVGGGLTATTVNAHGGILANAVGAIAAGNLNASTRIVANSSGGGVTLADVESLGGAVGVTANGAMTLGNVRAAGSVNLTGTAAIAAGNLTAGTGPLIATGGFGGGGGGGGTDAAPAGIAPGFDDFIITRCDDCFTNAVDLPFMINFFGVNRTQTFVSNNGYLTFNSGQGTFTPSGLGTGYSGQPIVAAFFADVDTRNTGSAQVTYGPGSFAGRTAFGATYQNVGYFASQADKLNSFQIVLADRADTGAGNFDIYYNYTGITWETGSASSGINGFGGVSAAVGFNAGTGNQPGTFFELPGSRVPGSFINMGPQQLITTTNNGTPGQLLFVVRNGQVTTGAPAEVPGIRVSNIATGNTADVTLGNLSGELVNVRSAGAATLGNSEVGDRGSGLSSDDRLTTNIEAVTSVTAGNVAGTGAITLRANSGALTAGAITGGSSITGFASGALLVDTANAFSDLDLAGQNITATSLVAGNDIDIVAAGQVTASTISASGARDGASNVTIVAPTAITVPRFAVVGDVALTAENGAVLVATDLAASGTVDATGRAVSLTSLGALNGRTLGATAGDLSVVSGGDLSVATGQSRGDVRLTSSGGNVTTNTLTTSATFGSPTATQVGPGDIIVAASGTATFNGPADARRNLTVNAANIAVNGTALGSAIALNSGNIMIDPQRAQIGAQGRTSSVTFSNTGNGVTTIGGNGVTTGYSLSNAELQRTFAGDIIILANPVRGTTPTTPNQSGTALNDRAPDVVLDTLTLAGANGQSGAMVGNIGSNGRLRIETSGKLRTVGAVSLDNLTSSNRFEILASQAIEIDAASGSISLRDAQQGLGGTLSLTSEDVIAAQLGLIPQIASAASTQAASDLLGVNPGAVSDDGYLRADSIVVNIGNGFYVQNSGAVSTNLRNFADRRGLTVGSGGLSINVPGGSTTGGVAGTPGTTRIVINGRQIAQPTDITPTAGFLTGIDFLQQVQVNGTSHALGTLQPGLFDPLSTINGCAILNFAACQVSFDDRVALDLFNDFDRLSPNDEDNPGSRGTLRLPFMLIQIRDPEEQAFQPVIDDPVTGSGNDDLWAVDDGRLCPEDEVCPPK